MLFRNQWCIHSIRTIIVAICTNDGYCQTVESLKIANKFFACDLLRYRPWRGDLGPHGEWGTAPRRRGFARVITPQSMTVNTRALHEYDPFSKLCPRKCGRGGCRVQISKIKQDTDDSQHGAFGELLLKQTQVARRLTLDMYPSDLTRKGYRNLNFSPRS